MKQVELAKALGFTPGYISQLKKRGMPVTSVEAATLWLVTNNKEGIGHKSGTFGVGGSAPVPAAQTQQA